MIMIIVDKVHRGISCLPKSVRKRFGAVFGDVVGSEKRSRDTPESTGRNDDSPFGLLDQRKKRHRDVDDSKGIDVIYLSVVFDSQPLNRPNLS